MIRLVILDFDGTLGDTRANIVLTMRRTLDRLGYPIPDEATIAATIGVPLERTMSPCVRKPTGKSLRRTVSRWYPTCFRMSGRPWKR